MFFLSLTGPGEQRGFLNQAHQELVTRPGHVVARLTPALVGLRHVVASGGFDDDGIAGDGRRFLGWAAGGHWMLPARAAARR